MSTHHFRFTPNISSHKPAAAFEVSTSFDLAGTDYGCAQQVPTGVTANQVRPEHERIRNLFECSLRSTAPGFMVAGVGVPG